MTRQTNLAFILFLVPAVAPARLDVQVCGTHALRSAEEKFLHRQSRQRIARLSPALRQAGPPSAARDVGDIALIDDSDGVVARRNLFNLERRFVLFQPQNAQAGAYRFESGSGGYDAGMADAGTPFSGLGDDDAREVALPFAFPFFGDTHRRLFVNSDGNLTFGTPDTATTDRSLGRMTSGAPRISALFTDLDPSRMPNSVRVTSSAARVVFSWVAVPEYQGSGFGPVNTFQITLLPNGVIQMAWDTIGTRASSVTGIAPGFLRGVSSVVSLSTPNTNTFQGAIAERFTTLDEVDIVFAAQKFYETHDDAYDYLAIYNNLGIASAAGAVAFEVSVRNDRLGIGDLLVDDGREYGSSRRLQAVLNMGQLSQYPVDPNAVVAARSLSRDTPLTVLAHEVGHLWLSFVSVREPNNPEVRPMLGRQSAHWAFTFNSEASLLEGNRIRDNGAGASPRFTTVGTVEGYAPLDQYLMGLLPPAEVPPTFYVRLPSIGTANRQPQSGVNFEGERRDVTIEELIVTEGRRTPDHTVSQRRFRIAFLLITRAGMEPTADQLAQVEGYRREFEPYFARATGNRASAVTSLRRDLWLSLSPAAGMVAGSRVNARLEVNSVAETPITVVLRAPNGVAAVPGSVIIPAGVQRVSFEITGVRGGIEDVSAEPSDSRYATAHARVQVADADGFVRLAIVSGDKQPVPAQGSLPNPVVLKVTDINNLPYPGAEVSVTADGGGSVQPSTAIADESGQVRLTWTPGSGLLQELRASLARAPAVTVVVTALGRPTITEGGVVNAASFVSGISPGSFASIFGVNLAGGQQASATLPLTTELNGVRVLVNGLRGTPVYVSDRQINFLVPENLAPGDAEVTVTTVEPAIAGSTNTVRVPVRLVDPGIFGILIAGTAISPQTTPVAQGRIIEVYATGLGAVRDGRTVNSVEANVGGIAAEVLFSGLAPGFPGLYQVNMRVPFGVTAPNPAVVLRIGAAASNAVPIRIE
jgi:uncharacterized protein (TIGR03437 family)